MGGYKSLDLIVLIIDKQPPPSGGQVNTHNWKDHWTAAFAEMRDINRMTTDNLTFANQAASQEIVQAEIMAALLDNLANASIQKNDTIDKLVATNQQQAKTIANLTEAIAKLKAGSPPMEQRLGCANPLHWRSTKPAWDPTGYCWMHDFWVNSFTSKSVPAGTKLVLYGRYILKFYVGKVP